jgi:hypothetical protein
MTRSAQSQRREIPHFRSRADHVMLGSDYCLDMGYLKPVQDLDVLGLKHTRSRFDPQGNAQRILRL